MVACPCGGQDPAGRAMTPHSALCVWAGPALLGGEPSTEPGKVVAGRGSCSLAMSNSRKHFSIPERLRGAGPWASLSPHVFRACKLCGHFTSDRGPGECGLALGQAQVPEADLAPLELQSWEGPRRHPALCPQLTWDLRIHTYVHSRPLYLRSSMKSHPAWDVNPRFGVPTRWTLPTH